MKACYKAKYHISKESHDTICIISIPIISLSLTVQYKLINEWVAWQKKTHVKFFSEILIDSVVKLGGREVVCVQC